MRKYVSLVHRGAQARNAAGAVVAARMRYAAGVVKDKVKARISTPAPPHSRPGEYPHMVTGRFQRSIRYRVETSKRQATLFSDDPKSVWLEYGTRFMRPRPTFRKAAREFKDVFESAFRTRASGSVEVR